MDNQYLVIKMPGNWIEREQCKQYYKRSVYGADLEFVDDKTIQAEYFIPESVLLRFGEDFKNHSKKRIATHIGEQLLEKGMLNFTETQERGVGGLERGLVIKAQITIINDHPPSGADMRGDNNAEIH